MSKPLVLTILSGGGFTFETRCLLGALGEHVELFYLRTEWGGVPGEGGLPPGRDRLVPSFATVTRPSRLASIRAFLGTFAAACMVLRREPVQLVLAIGCSHAVPMFLAARLMGRRTLFVESITRTDRLSGTGRLVLRLRLATRFLVQWPGLQRRTPGAGLGTIL